MPPSQKPSRQPGKKWDYVGVAIGLAGLILGAIVLESRPTASLEAATDPRNIFSTQIVISNDGAIPLEDVDVGVFIRGVRYLDGSVMQRASGTRYQPPSNYLGIGQKKTIKLAPFNIVSSSPVTDADIGLIVCYRPILIPDWLWWGDPRVFRFDSVVQSDETARLRQQPDDGKLLAEYADMLAENGKTPCPKIQSATN